MCKLEAQRISEDCKEQRRSKWEECTPSPQTGHGLSETNISFDEEIVNQAYLEERMANSCVSFNRDGNCEVDRTSEADVSHWKKNGDDVEVASAALELWSDMWKPKEEKRNDDVNKIIDCQT